MTMYSPPDYHLVRSITPAGCGGDFWLEPNGNLLFVVGGIGCGATAVEEYSNSGKLLLTISGFGTTPINVTTDAGGNAYVLGVSEKEISGYCYQSKPRVYVYASGSSEPKYVIDKGLSNRSFVQMTVDSTGYLYVEFEVPNPIKGDSPGWNAIVAYAPSATTPAYTIPVRRCHRIGTAMAKTWRRLTGSCTSVEPNLGKRAAESRSTFIRSTPVRKRTSLRGRAYPVLRQH